MCSFNSSGLMSTYHQCVLVPCYLDESKWNDTESKQYLLSRKTRGEIKIWCALMIKYNVLECMKRYGKDIVTYNFQIIARSSKHTNSWDIQLYQEILLYSNKMWIEFKGFLKDIYYTSHQFCPSEQRSPLSIWRKFLAPSFGSARRSRSPIFQN